MQIIQCNEYINIRYTWKVLQTQCLKRVKPGKLLLLNRQKFVLIDNTLHIFNIDNS